MNGLSKEAAIHDRIRDCDIARLLGREPLHSLGSRARDALAGKTVMVTGAGGSIGSELSRQVAGCDPRLLLLVDRAESALFAVQNDLERLAPGARVVPLLADVTSRPRLTEIFERFHPRIVLHAAAHKHLPLLENNVCEGVVNNVLGTELPGHLAGEFNAEAMVLISTDKAVRPRSILGATKRIAELVIHELDRRYACRSFAVRFGNVIGSAGSVVSIFRNQIRAGGPVTVTHPEMTRYFMTVQEAAQLVLEALALGRGGEVFTLDMGEPVEILSLARDMISLSGLRPYADIDITFIGARPGEKFREDLSLEENKPAKTRHPKIFAEKIACTPAALPSSAIAELERLASAGKASALRTLLGRLIPESDLERAPAPIDRGLPQLIG